MKFRSLTGRLIATVLCIEFVLALFVTMAALYYQRRESLRAFDVMLRGRADSVLGSVQDADDPADNVLLDKSSLDLPAQDLYEVREENGRFVGSSPGMQDVLSTSLKEEETGAEDRGRAHNVKFQGSHYRGYVLHGVRLIDPAEPGSAAGGKGILHRIVVYYASSIHPVHAAVWSEARFFLVADSLALLLSVAAVALLMRRSLRPLDALALQAAAISPRSWSFEAPTSAYQLNELAPLAGALDTALHGLHKAFQQQRNFVNDAAHELKTAVTVLKSSLQLLTFRDRTKDEYQEGIEGCLADCGRMEELVQRMLHLARIEQVEASVAPAAGDVSFAEVARQVLTQLESAAALRRVELRAEIDDERMTRVPEDDCSVLMNNLVMNAIQHSPEGSAVRVRLAPSSAAQLELTVADKGEGIASEHLPFIFERFYRTDASRSRDTGGTGLGLAICRAIVEAQGGSIGIESHVQQGTTVTVTLPVSVAAAEQL